MILIQVPPLPPAPAGGQMSMTAFVLAAVTVLLFPLVVAFAIRMIRRSALTAPAPQFRESPERLERLEQAVDTIALEVERISEGQRFVTKLLTEKGGVPVDVARALNAGRKTPVTPV